MRRLMVGKLPTYFSRKFYCAFDSITFKVCFVSNQKASIYCIFSPLVIEFMPYFMEVSLHSVLLPLFFKIIVMMNT